MMKNIVKNSVVTLVALTVGNTQLLANNSHCNESENVIFSCNTGKKVVSVCASKILNAKTGYMQYRFGKLGTSEALIPSKPETFRQNASAFQMTHRETGRLLAYGLNFKNGQISYQINLNFQSGVNSLDVFNKDKNIASLTCQDDGSLIDNFDKFDFQKIGLKVEN
jgi:exopolysaccharide biosynthesis protein